MGKKTMLINMFDNLADKDGLDEAYNKMEALLDDDQKNLVFDHYKSKGELRNNMD
jgi:hypothetical protein